MKRSILRLHHLSFLPIVCLLLFTTPTTAQPANGIQLVGQDHMSWKGVRDVVKVGNLAYLAVEQTGMVIMDVSDPMSPIELGYSPTAGLDWTVKIAGTYAYVADSWDDEVAVIDISDPTYPVRLASVEFGSAVYDVEISGNYAFAANWQYGFHVIDISVPPSPVLVASMNQPDFIRDIELHGNYAFVTSGHDGVGVIDISMPENPQVVIMIPVPGESDAVAIWNETLYVVTEQSILHSYDISVPSSPIAIGSYDMPHGAMRIKCEDDICYYLGGGAGELLLLDISNPLVPPPIIGTFDSPGLPMGIAIDGNIALLADYDSGLRVLDLSNPSNPVEIASYDRLQYAIESVATVDHFALVTKQRDGLRVMDLSDPTNPTEVSSFTDIGILYEPHDIVTDGDYAYVCDNSRGLRIFDISDPLAIEATGYYDAVGWGANDIVVLEGLAYYAEYWGVRVINVTNPYAPFQVTSMQTPGDCRGLAVQGDYIYVADGHSGLRIIDKSNLGALTEVGFYFTPGNAQNVIVAGDYAYMTTWFFGLEIIDVSDPTNPVFVGRYDSPGTAYSLQLDGDYVYLTDRTGGFRVVNVSDPTAPYQTGFFTTVNTTVDVTSYGDYVLVTSEQILHVFDCSEATTPPAQLTLTNLTGDIPADGGVLLYDVTLVNNTGGTFTGVDFWTSVLIPGGQILVPLYFQGGLTVTPFMNVTVSGLQVVPVFAPAGEYTYTGHLGYYPNDELSDSFSFNKLGAARVTHGSSFNFDPADWIASGEIEFVDSQPASSPGDAIEPVTGVALPDSFILESAYPNPFNSSTTIKVILPIASELQLTVSNIAGQQVAVLADGAVNSGHHSFTFDASDLASGVYFVHAFTPGELNEIQKILLIR